MGQRLVLTKEQIEAGSRAASYHLGDDPDWYVNSVQYPWDQLHMVDDRAQAATREFFRRHILRVLKAMDIEVDYAKTY